MRNLFLTISMILLSTCVIPLNEISNLSNLTEEKLNPPIGLTLFPYSANSAIISWQEVENANSYSIYVSRNEFGIYELVQTINESTFVMPDLLLDIKYFFKVSVSINNLGESNLSQQAAITIVDLPKPTGLTAFTVSPTTIKITWANIIEATGYKIYRSTATSGHYTLIGSTNEMNYTDNELETGTTYFYRVSGVKNDGEGVSSDYISTFTPVAIPTGITGIVQSMNSIRISWDPVYRSSEYNIYRSLTQDGQYNLIGTTTELFYIDNGLAQLTDYYYRISAKNSNGEGSQSEYVIIAIAPPHAPIAITSSVLSSSSIKLDWENVVGATSYNVYRSTGGEYSLISTVSGNTFTNTGLSLNFNYYYKISSINIAGEGSQSEYINVIIQTPSSPSNVIVGPASSSSLLISWDAANGATLYNIYNRYIEYDFVLYRKVGTTTNTEFLISNLTPGSGQLLNYCITSINGVGESGYSSYSGSYVSPISLTEGIIYTDSVPGTTYYGSYYPKYYSFQVNGGSYNIEFEAETNAAFYIGSYTIYWKSNNTIDGTGTQISNSYNYTFEAPEYGFVIIRITAGSNNGTRNYKIRYSRNS